MKNTKTLLTVIILSLVLIGCTSNEDGIYASKNSQGVVEHESEDHTSPETNNEETLSLSSFEDLSINTELIENNYYETGPEPRESHIDLSLVYYQLSGDVSTDFLEQREDFFSAISEFQLQKEQEFKNFLQSNNYNDLDYISGMNHEIHHTKEYLERNDLIIYSSLVVCNGTYGGPGYCDYYTFNYDVQNGTELILADVVNDYDSLKNFVVDAVISNPPSIFYNDDPDYIGSFIDNTFYNKDVSDGYKANWTLDENGLTIYYSKTQIGDAYRCTIPYSEDCINPSYRLVEGVDYNSEYLK